MNGLREPAEAAERSWPPMVAIDLGAGSCRVSRLRWTVGKPDVTVVHRFPNAPVQEDNQESYSLRWDIEAIHAGVEEGLRRCAAISSEPIESIGVDGWAVDYVRLNDAGDPVAAPFCYRDGRNDAAGLAVHRLIDEHRLYELTGLQRLRFNTVYQLYADKLAGAPPHLPWINLPEYVLHKLGGRRVSEYTNATHTGLVDLQTRGWCGEIFEALGLDPNAAPEIVATGTDVGQVKGPLGRLPAFRNTRLIAPACHDTASAIAAIGGQEEDWAYISSGTWSLIGRILNEPCTTEAAYHNNFTNLGAAAGRICFHKSVNGMWLIQQCLEHWDAAGSHLNLKQIIEEAAKVKPPDACLDVDDPALMLPGDMPSRINAQRQSKGLIPVCQDAQGAPVLASLIFHSLARRYAEVLQELAETTSRPVRELCIVGGGGRNRLLNALTAEACGCEVRTGHVESSTIGNFAVQMAALMRKTASDAIPERHIRTCAAQLERAHYD